MANLQKKIINLLSAIKTNDTERICKILVKNRELVNHPECVDKDGASPLWRAIFEGYDNIVEWFVRDFGADPDEKCLMKNECFYGWTFLEYAVKRGSKCSSKVLLIAEILIKHGADVNAEVEFEPDECAWTETLLKIAVWYGNLEFIELLLKNGVKYSTKETYLPHCESIMTIILKQNIRKQLLLLFVKYGLDTADHIKSEFRKNQLHSFIKKYVRPHDRDAVDIVKILIEQSPEKLLIDGLDKKNLTPLHHAIQVQNIPLIKFFIDNGANVNKQMYRTYGNFPLTEAVRLKRVDIIRLLISNGADVNAKTIFDGTALHSACNLERFENNFAVGEKIIRLLLQRGAAVSVINKSLQTPFSKLLSSDNYSDNCVRLIIREFSKVSFENNTILSEDMDLLHAHPRAREYFEECLAEVEHMESIKFYGHFTYFSVLKMSKNIKKLALLTKNAEFSEEFLAKFNANSDYFSDYKDDLLEIFKESLEVRDEMMAAESRLKYIFGNFFPDVVIKVLSDNFTLVDLPLD